MTDFIMCFFICNLFISLFIGILFFIKFVFKRCLTASMQYHMWFVLPGVLILPFLPIGSVDFLHIVSLIKESALFSSFYPEHISIQPETIPSPAATSRLQDFALSVSGKMPSPAWLLLCGIWITGMLVMLFLFLKSCIRLNTLKKSALPVQNTKIRFLYINCQETLHIRKPIPIYSTAYLKSPVIAHVLRPRIYVPLHLISGYREHEMRHMLLHELVHYKHRDTLIHCVMNLIIVPYWFNPLVWYAKKQMSFEQELACDSSVLKNLSKTEYEAYGHTLLSLAEKNSLPFFPFAAGISSHLKQMQKRILNIASYRTPSARSILKAFPAFVILAALLIFLSPTLSAYASSQNHVSQEFISGNISTLELSSCFQEYEGSFVLYYPEENSWSIYDLTHATTRTSPNSTYKIYNALFGLEEGVIRPDDSRLNWNGTKYSFEEWNADQNLNSAMRNSVNWYFETIDKALGASRVNDYIRTIGYGNENILNDFPLYWMESSLKISPVEQVRLLSDFYNNSFDFNPEHIAAVKNSLLLSSCPDGQLYGKTGTGRIDGCDVNGWFVGFLETPTQPLFFATNIQSTKNATGTRAADITMSVLTNLGILECGTHTSESPSTHFP